MRSRPFANHNATSVFAALLIAIALLAAACGSDEPDTAAPVGGQTGNDTGGHDEFSFDEPADADDADRVIDIDATDSLSFGPNDIEVEVGETVTFRATNVGKLPHDFTIGDSDTQDDHEAEMAEMPMAGMGVDDVNAMTMDPGATKDMTWTFTEAGEIRMGCHIPGHYAAACEARSQSWIAAEVRQLHSDRCAAVTQAPGNAGRQGGRLPRRPPSGAGRTASGRSASG